MKTLTYPGVIPNADLCGRVLGPDDTWRPGRPMALSYVSAVTRTTRAGGAAGTGRHAAPEPVTLATVRPLPPDETRIYTDVHGQHWLTADALYALATAELVTAEQAVATQTTVQGDAVLEFGVDVADCLFRMLEPDEIKLGMAFSPGFVLLGSAKRDKVKMCGNAVTPPMARDLIGAVVEAITGDDLLGAVA